MSMLLRFAMRLADAGTGADQYAAAVEMGEWGEANGVAALVLSQHHGCDDGYLPSPVVLAAAMAARTSTTPISVAALLLALYEPVKLAEDLAVLDLLSRGRVSYVVGLGYRDVEYAMFGVDRRTRAGRVEESLAVLRQAWTGAEVEHAGRRVRVTPLPHTPGGPVLMYGGGSEAAARRAGRLGLFFLSEADRPDLGAVYEAAARATGREPVGCMFPSAADANTTFVADDPDRAWAEVGPYLLRDARPYQAWNASRAASGAGPVSLSRATTIDELRAERGAYRIVTPGEATAVVRSGRMLQLQPLCGGLPPDLAWPYLETAAAAVRAAGA
jgi:alkanesulfonate monooxygenase SsuD/methylene tetrahydromethanopterin reductase-like flavin-dependent oxidoreductase (luciferase family)